MDIIQPDLRVVTEQSVRRETGGPGPGDVLRRRGGHLDSELRQDHPAVSGRDYILVENTTNGNAVTLDEMVTNNYFDLPEV